jgi:hypothetical protein
MAGLGGARPGAGRKPLHEELRVRNLCIAAIEQIHGTLQDGLVSLLQSGEPTLIKFVYEHAIGKPKENINIDAIQSIEQIQVIQIPDNGRDIPAITTEIIDADN